MAFICQFDYVGVPAISQAYAADTVQRAPLGAVAVATDPFWGIGEFVYLKSGATIAVGTIVVWDNTYTALNASNATANQSRPCAVALMATTIGQFFWGMRTGLFPIAATASVATLTSFGLTSVTGQIGAFAAGKQVNNSISMIASAGTKVLTNVQTTNGSPILVTQGYDGWFIGGTLSGTGISGTITALNPDGRTVTSSANSTATGSISATLTFTNFNVCQFSNMALQGQIT
jgi:hypothetical protein